MEIISILGSTGSIGCSALDVIKLHPDKFKVFALSGHKNTSLLFKQTLEFNPSYVVVKDENSQSELSILFKEKNLKTEILIGEEGHKYIAGNNDVTLVLAAITGSAGLISTMEAAKKGKKILLANKESMVMAGNLLSKECEENNGLIIPVDSEHNAIFQCLDSEKNTNDVSKIIITASGGPFEGKKLLDLKDVTKKEALNHPNWDMGSKISIDSATLVNKCLELIEARYLFDLNEKYFELVIHPQSIIHSIVTYIDGSSLCHMSNPDMKVPISHALSDSNRLPINFLEIDFSSLELTFKNFPSDRKNLENIAREICNVGGSSGTIFNAANEIAVQDFLLNKIKFNDIYEVIYRTFDAITVSNNLNVEAIYEIDHQARMEAEKMVKSIT